ncbi:YYY membrane protein, partial [gut metagenome]
CFLLFLHQQKKNIQVFPEQGLTWIVWEELLFFGIFLFWTYLAGFHPAAYGTEKFMDYGFMEAMMRSKVLPAKDLWYSQGHINYYYGGQYFAVFLTKLSGSKVALTYNLMRTFVAGLAFVLPFSLVSQMVADQLKKREGRIAKAAPTLAGLLAGGAVSLAGNMH